MYNLAGAPLATDGYDSKQPESISISGWYHRRVGTVYDAYLERRGVHARGHRGWRQSQLASEHFSLGQAAGAPVVGDKASWQASTSPWGDSAGAPSAAIARTVFEDRRRDKTPDILVDCPCCSAKLTIDPVLRKVIAHEEPQRQTNAPDLDRAGSPAAGGGGQAGSHVSPERGERKDQVAGPGAEVRGSLQEKQGPAGHEADPGYRSLVRGWRISPQRKRPRKRYSGSESACWV